MGIEDQPGFCRRRLVNEAANPLEIDVAIVKANGPQPAKVNRADVEAGLGASAALE
jgi:hypothetical protein